MERYNLEDYKVAIIIPAIKRKFLRKTLRSIFLQSIDNFHIYIGDDASQEDLQSIISDFPQDKITYRKFKTNLGSYDLISHWKRCIAMSNNEPWIWLFSDDDIMSSNCIEQFIALANKQKSDFYRFQTRKIDENDNIVFESLLPNVTNIDLFLNKKLSYKIESYAVECIFRRKMLDVFNQIPHTPLGWCFDDILWIKLLTYSFIYTIPNAWVYWRCSKLNISGGYDDKDSAIKKLDACCIFLKEMQKMNLTINRETLLRYWAIKQYIDKIQFVDSLDCIKKYFSLIPLLKRNRTEYYAVPATFEQEQCWNYHIQSKDCISPQVLFFNYQLNVSSLEEANQVVNKLVMHNDSLRSSFIKEDDNLMLIISRFNPHEKYCYYSIYNDMDDYKSSLDQFIQNNEQSLDIRKNNSLVRIIISSISSTDFYLHVFIHHLLCDEYSLSLMKSQLDTNFKKGIENNDNTIADYTLWQRRQWKSHSIIIKDYWKQKLSKAMKVNYSYTFHESGIRQYDRNVFLQILETSCSELYRTKLTSNSTIALRKIQKKNTPSLLCIFFYAIRFLFFQNFSFDKILISSPLRNITNRRFRDTIGYMAGGLYSYDKYEEVENIKNDIERYYFSLLQSMRYLISNHKVFGLDEQELRLSNGIYINIMPLNYRVDIIEEDYEDKTVHVNNMTYYPLEIYVIEKENAFFIEYAFNTKLYTKNDIVFFNKLLNTSLLNISHYE